MVNKVLKKRIPRDLKANFFFKIYCFDTSYSNGYFYSGKYGGCFADVITEGTNKRAVSCNTEDGEFNVFIPLSDSQISDLKRRRSKSRKDVFHRFTAF